MKGLLVIWWFLPQGEGFSISHNHASVNFPGYMKIDSEILRGYLNSASVIRANPKVGDLKLNFKVLGCPSVSPSVSFLVRDRTFDGRSYILEYMFK